MMKMGHTQYKRISRTPVHDCNLNLLLTNKKELLTTTETHRI